MNIIFMGTPEFAVPTLKAIIDSGNTVSAVFTQPDKPKGRGYKLTPPPVKVLATEHGINVYQPNSLKKGDDAAESLKIISELAPDVIVVVAYGKLLPKEILDIPTYGCINVHASLLPKYRGAGPIQWSVLNGEEYTGVTTMLMAEGMDTGDMLLSERTEISPDETADELHDRLSEIGARLLIKTLESVKSNSITPIKQDESAATYAPMLGKELCPIDFSKPAAEVHSKIMGLSSWPCATAYMGDKRIKIYRSAIADGHYSEAAGTIVNADSFTVVCGDGRAVIIRELQLDGGKRMKTPDFLRGNRIEKGLILK